MSYRRTAAVACTLAAAVVPATAVAADAKARPKTLTLFNLGEQTEYSGIDIGSAGLSKGDVYVSTSPVRNKAGKAVGTYDVSCTVVDEDDGAGLARVMCNTSTSLGRRDEIVTAGTVLGRPTESITNGLGILPLDSRMAIVGGTGRFARARGVFRRTRTDDGGTLRFRYWLPRGRQ